MFKEDKKLGLPTPGDYAKSALADLILYVFMAISAVITIFIAIDKQSWWPFAGWFVLVFAFGLLLERIVPNEGKRVDLKFPDKLAKSAVKGLVFCIFLVISAVITIFIAIDMRSWWPFAGWFVVVIAFGFLIQRMKAY